MRQGLGKAWCSLGNQALQDGKKPLLVLGHKGMCQGPVQDPPSRTLAKVSVAGDTVGTLGHVDALIERRRKLKL